MKDKEPAVGGNFWRGVKFALIPSLLLWVAVVWATCKAVR